MKKREFYQLLKFDTLTINKNSQNYIKIMIKQQKYCKLKL